MDFFTALGLFGLVVVVGSIASGQSREQVSGLLPEGADPVDVVIDEEIVTAEVVEAEARAGVLVQVVGLSLPESLQGGSWACCFLRLLADGSVQLAGVPVQSATGCVKRLENLGAVQCLVLSAGSGPLVVISFQASERVIASLSERFPSACALG